MAFAQRAHPHDGGSRYVEGGLGFLVVGFLGFEVSWFLGFVVSWFRCFLVSKFQSFKVSKIYQITISCSLEDIDPISKIFKKFEDGSSCLFGACLFPRTKSWISYIMGCITIIFVGDHLFFPEYLRYLGFSKDK